MTAVEQSALQKKNRKLAWQLVLVAVFFAGFGFALVPMYNVFCRVTGLNGKTNDQAEALHANTQVDKTRWVNVQFLSNVQPGLGLNFAPETFQMRVHPGEVVHTSYTIRNTMSRSFLGQAVPSVSPAVGAPYFQKIECFCFSQQTVKAGESRTLPVVFVVQPELSADIGTLTLSYTFYEVPKARG